MKLAQLLSALQSLAPDDAQPQAAGGNGGTDVQVNVQAIYCRAQDVTPGGLFVAIKGFATDGHAYIEQAVARGAAVVVCEQPAAVAAVVVRVSDSRKALAALAAEFYGHPSRHMTVVGITGTNGKTTTSYLIESILQAAGYAAGVIGTVNYRYGGRLFDNPVTTPESLDLQRILADMRSAGVSHVVMEISSHALDLCRVHACDVDVAVFTNLTQDHLDFHQDMDSYWACKRKLFNDCLPASHGKTGLRAVVNIDDARGAELAATLAMPHLTTSQRQTAAIQAVSATFDLNGIAARVQTPEDMCEVHSALVGRHNLENILNAMGVGIALGLPTAVLQEGVRALTAVPGRLERVADPGGCFVYVDYSHTPDALQNTLQALRELTTQHIICVFGCGGDRDRSKRPLMGKIAANLSDLAVVTSDNPRTEPPQQIIAQILEGVRAFRGREYSPETLTDGIGQKGFVVEPDRRNAIMLAVAVAQPGDTILIAGKGHETYQIIGRQKFAFDDRKVAAEESEKKWQVRR